MLSSSASSAPASRASASAITLSARDVVFTPASGLCSSRRRRDTIAVEVGGQGVSGQCDDQDGRRLRSHVRGRRGPAPLVSVIRMRAVAEARWPPTRRAPPLEVDRPAPGCRIAAALAAQPRQVLVERERPGPRRPAASRTRRPRAGSRGRRRTRAPPPRRRARRRARPSRGERDLLALPHRAAGRLQQARRLVHRLAPLERGVGVGHDRAADMEVQAPARPPRRCGSRPTGRCPPRARSSRSRRSRARAGPARAPR